MEGNAPPHLTFVPAQIDFRQDDLPAPDAVLSSVLAIAQAASPPRLIRLPSACVFEVEASITPQGPVPPGTIIRAQGSTPIRRVDVATDSLLPGSQPLRMRIAADLPTRTASKSLSVDLEFIHNGTTGVELKPCTVVLTVPGPEPVPLIHVDEYGRPQDSIHRTVRDDQTVLPLVLRPQLLGVASQGTATFSARLEGIASGTPGGVTTLPLDRASTIQLPIPDRRQPSFFFDESHTLAFHLSPSAPTPNGLPLESVLRSQLLAVQKIRPVVSLAIPASHSH